MTRTGWMFAVLLLGLGAVAARAENLVSVRLAPLPQFDGTPELLFAAGDRLFIAQGDAIWELGGARDRWTRSAWTPPGRIRGVIDRADRPLLMLQSASGAGIDRVEDAFGLIGSDEGMSRVRLPPLPATLSHACGAVLGSALHVVGSDDANRAWWLVLDLQAPAPVWRTGSPAPLEPRSLTSLVAQDGGLHVTARATGARGDALWRWSPADGWSRRGTLPGAVVEGSARAIGQAHVLYLARIPAEPAGGSASAARLVSYHTITDAFATQGDPVAASMRAAARYGNGLVWHQTGASPGRSALVSAQIVGSKQLLRPLDWIMILAYLVAIAGIGVYCFRKEEKNSTSEFFVGSRAIPFWAAAVSLYVTSTSSIGYIGTTAKAFATNWQYLVGNVTTVFGLFFVAVWIVPMLRRLKLVSVFDYLEQRFHPSVRMMASAMCILLHLSGRMSIILFLPAFAIATITGLSVVASILIMGVVTMGYTALGGMRAVIWTDFLQLIVKVGGLVFALAFIWLAMKSDFGATLAAAEAAGKTKMWDWSFDLTQATVWGFIFVVVMETVLTFPKDQVLMQRVFTTKSDKEAGRSVWMFAAIIIPGAWLFYAIGTGLWAYYRENPERMNPLLSVDATFPLFIAAELPQGITGLMIAGIFAASMATCSSIMNSVATMVSVDFYERLAKNPTQRTSIRIAEFVTVLAGLIGIGLALLLSSYDIGSYLDVALELYGLMGGGFGGAYTLGMFSRRANWQGVLIGMFASVVLTFAAWWVDLVHPFVYLGIAILISIVVGYVASLFFPPPKPEALEGLIVQPSLRRSALIEHQASR